jgi:hypothetical protein
MGIECGWTLRKHDGQISMELSLRFEHFLRQLPRQLPILRLSFFASKHGTVMPAFVAGSRTKFQKISITALDGQPATGKEHRHG